MWGSDRHKESTSKKLKRLGHKKLKDDLVRLISCLILTALSPTQTLLFGRNPPTLYRIFNCLKNWEKGIYFSTSRLNRHRTFGAVWLITPKPGAQTTIINNQKSLPIHITRSYATKHIKTDNVESGALEAEIHALKAVRNPHLAPFLGVFRQHGLLWVQTDHLLL